MGMIHFASVSDSFAGKASAFNMDIIDIKASAYNIYNPPPQKEKNFTVTLNLGFRIDLSLLTIEGEQCCCFHHNQ